MMPGLCCVRNNFKALPVVCLSTNRCPLAVATPIGVVLVHPESAVLPRHACGRLTKQLFVCPYNLPEREASLCFSPDSRARPSKSKSTDHLSGPSGSSLLLRARDVERLVLAHALLLQLFLDVLSYGITRHADGRSERQARLACKSNCARP